ERIGEEGARHVAALLPSALPLLHLVCFLVEFIGRPDRQTAVVLRRQHRSLTEDLAKASREDDPPLGVQGVLELPEKPACHHALPSSATRPSVGFTGPPGVPFRATLRPDMPPVNPAMPLCVWARERVRLASAGKLLSWPSPSALAWPRRRARRAPPCPGGP